MNVKEMKEATTKILKRTMKLSKCQAQGLPRFALQRLPEAGFLERDSAQVLA